MYYDNAVLILHFPRLVLSKLSCLGSSPTESPSSWRYPPTDSSLAKVSQIIFRYRGFFGTRSSAAHLPGIEYQRGRESGFGESVFFDLYIWITLYAPNVHPFLICCSHDWIVDMMYHLKVSKKWFALSRHPALWRWHCLQLTANDPIPVKAPETPEGW